MVVREVIGELVTRRDVATTLVADDTVERLVTDGAADSHGVWNLQGFGCRAVRPGMSDIDPDSTIGIYTGSDADMIEEFDEFFETQPGNYSRSGEIKTAMRVYLAVKRAEDDLGLDIPDRSLGAWVRTALKEQDRREQRQAEE